MNNSTYKFFELYLITVDFVEFKKFSSPREEALEIAYQSRKDILSGKIEVVSLLRQCLVIAENLKKKKDEEWIFSELTGYGTDQSEIPRHRSVACAYEDENGIFHEDLRWIRIGVEVHLLDSKLRRNEELRLIMEDKTTAIIDTIKIERVMSQITNECLFFLNKVISELQYGGAIQYIVEEIRNEVDSKLSKLNPKISDEIDSLYLNLSSTNPADWYKVADSSRRIIIFLADSLFPAREGLYKMTDGREIEINEGNYINRLLAFVDQTSNSSGHKQFLLAEIQYLESYLRKVVEFTQMGVHTKNISKFSASMIATHTYLVISDVLKLNQEKPKINKEIN